MEIAITDRLKDINSQIVPYNPKIIAVTKYFDETAITKYFEAGLRDFGENRVLDALNKIELLDREIKENSRFHLIGHLQKNKVKKAVGKFYLIHSVDSVELARLISEEAQKQGITQKVLVQINNAREPQKSGFYPEEIFEAFGNIMNLPNIKVAGLMNMAPLTEDREKILSLFNGVAKIKSEIENKFNYRLDELSMGMSNDYDLAAKAGSTMIRLGRVLYS